jgi:hypothetical protein
VNRVSRFSYYRTFFVNGLTEQVKDSAQRLFSDRRSKRRTDIYDIHSPAKAEGAAQSDGPNPAFAQVLLDFAPKAGLAGAEVALHLDRVIQSRHVLGRKLGVKNAAHYLR